MDTLLEILKSQGPVVAILCAMVWWFVKRDERNENRRDDDNKWKMEQIVNDTIQTKSLETALLGLSGKVDSLVALTPKIDQILSTSGRSERN